MKKGRAIPEGKASDVDLASFTPVCDAIALLFQPYAEVVLHDLATETVVYIANNFSKRELGEPSLLNEIDFRPSDLIIGPYEKVNWDGRRIKSVSAVLRSQDRPVGILCINVDVSHFHAVMQTLNALVSVPQMIEKPASLFKEDWHERINEYIHAWTTERGLSIAEMTRAQKQQLVTDLAGDGAFGGRNAAAYISRVLGLGRATIYNYLRK
jgi:predicted transcriptional regulator YheO